VLLNITALTFRGEGLGFAAGDRAVGWRVANTVPGDIVEAEPLETERGPRRARLLQVLEPSPDRVASACEQSERCGGCQLRCVSLPRQHAHKMEAWRDTLERLAGIAFAPARVHAAAAQDGARGSAVLQAQGSENSWTLGMRPRGSRVDKSEASLREGSVPSTARESDQGGPAIDLARCPAQTPDVRELIAEVRSRLALLPDTLRSRLGLVRVEGAESLVGGARVVFGVRGEGLSEDERTSLVTAAGEGRSVLWKKMHASQQGFEVGAAPQVLSGSGELWVRGLDGLELRYGAESWIPNSLENARAVGRHLLTVVDELVGPRCAGLVEFGCGVGTHSFELAERAERFVGIDRSRSAIRDAEANAALRQRTGLVFRVGRAERLVRKLASSGVRAELAVMHSMRLPFGWQLIRGLRALGTRFVVHVSPSAMALAKDAADLAREGFVLSRLELLDTMPHTYHCMGVSSFERVT